MELSENFAAANFGKHGCVFVIVLFCKPKFCTVNYNSKAFQAVIQLPIITIHVPQKWKVITWRK